MDRYWSCARIRATTERGGAISSPNANHDAPTLSVQQTHFQQLANRQKYRSSLQVHTKMLSYQRLSSDPIEKRLVQIKEARSLDDPIHLRMYHVQFHSNPTYSTLSYTWGSPAAHFPSEWDDPASTVTVWVNRTPFEVRRNLESALRHLRKFPWMIQTFRIDAICIDQEFVPERNDQVMRMRDIYSKAISTVVWLGPADDDMHLALKKIWELFELWKSRGKAWKIWPVDPKIADE